MITVQTDREVIRSGEFREQHFKLAQNAHIFKILRDGIYSDKPLAVIREYWANARDEHKKYCPGKPVEITVPSYLNPYLKIRDYGKGLTYQEVKDIYIVYGESTKTDSNDFIGALGIGSKSGFCYTSAFQVTSYMNGKASVYSCYIDESEMGKIAHVDTTPTDEPNGVEISVPVNSSDFSLFKDKIRQLFLYAKERPIIKGDPNFTFDEPEYLMEGSFWAILGDSTQSYCMMGDVPYSLDVNAFQSTYASVVASVRKQEMVNQEVLVEEGKLDKIDVSKAVPYPEQLPSAIYNLLNGYHVLLRFNIGEIEMAASREALSYKTKTILGIYNKLEETIKDIERTCKLEVDNCKTFWDAKRLWSKYYINGVHHNIGELLRAIGKVVIKWNDKDINNASIFWVSAKIVPPLPPTPAVLPQPVDSQGNPITDPLVLKALTAQTPPPPPSPLDCIAYRRKSNGRMEKYYSTEIDAGVENIRIIINDTGTSRGVFTSMNCLMPRNAYGSTYFVFNYLNKENHDSLVKLLTEYGVPFEYLSRIDIPKPDKANRPFSTKNSKKFFVFNPNNISSKDSDYWDIVDIDPEEDEGIYVAIDRYIPQFDGKPGNTSLKSVVKFIESVENKPLVVYGVKTAAVEKLGDNWTKLDKYCNEVGARIMSDINYDQVLADYQQLESLKQDKHLLEMFLGVYKWGKDYFPPTAKIHEAHKPIRMVIENHRKYQEKSGLVEMMQVIGHTTDATKAIPTCDVKNVLEKGFMEAYPMIRYSQNAYRAFYHGEDKKRFLQEAATYVRTVETAS